MWYILDFKRFKFRVFLLIDQSSYQCQRAKTVQLFTHTLRQTIWIHSQTYGSSLGFIERSFLLERRRRGLMLYSAGVEREQLHLRLKSVVFSHQASRSKILGIFWKNVKQWKEKKKQKIIFGLNSLFLFITMLNIWETEWGGVTHEN